MTASRTISCKDYSIYVNQLLSLTEQLEKMNPSSLFVLTDQNSEKWCLPHLLEILPFPLTIISIPAGEVHKDLETCQLVWSRLLEGGADRKSVLLNLGGGVIGDLGGFCAATYMRGIPFIQIPTTLLSQVDASVGGKLGVDLNGMKNMVGVIHPPAAVHIVTDFLSTLPARDVRSGYAEMIKHGLIADASVWKRLSAGMPTDPGQWGQEVVASVSIKRSVTEQDPFEKNIRKILNFGHTIGHAVESLWLNSPNPPLHGEAIAIGMVAEAFVSYHKGLLTENELFDIREAIIRIFGHHPRWVNGSDEIIRIMHSDKKNEAGQIRMSLLSGIGNAVYDVPVDTQLIREALLFYREKL